jgi:hypothetical protein
MAQPRKFPQFPVAETLTGNELVLLWQGLGNRRITLDTLKAFFGEGGGTELSQDIIDALEGANLPSGSNVFATMADVSVRDDNAVHYDTADGKNDTEKAQARDNISVYSILEINNITGDLTDLNTSDKDNLVVGINQANSWKIIEW